MEGKTLNTKQERRALLYAMRSSDGEHVIIPIEIAQKIRKDLEALQKIRQTIHILER